MAKIIFGKHWIMDEKYTTRTKRIINIYSLYEFEYQLTKINLKCGFETALDNICMSINSVRNILSHQCSLVKLC